MIRQTPRDASALEWLSQMYGAPLDVVARLLGVREEGARAVVTRWRRARWVNVAKVDIGPLWVWPIRETARDYLGWDPGHWRPRPTTSAHYRAITETRLFLQRGFVVDGWEGERALRHRVAQGRIREMGDQYPHVPDGVLTTPDGRKWVVEVELTPKSPERTYGALEEGIGGRLGMVDLFAQGVIYVCTEPARRAVDEGLRRLSASHGGGPQPVQILTYEEIRSWTR